MKFIYLVLLVLAALSLGQAGWFSRYENYAVLIAGSNTYRNYRHQADVYHAYQILKNQGIKEENIITMAYNDIAHDPKNPWPGQVFNHNSGSEPGVDVYEGVKIDYEGDDVNKENLMAVLKGDSANVKGGNGRVLKSGPKDNVFLFYSDHGNVGLVGMPFGKNWYTDEIIGTLQYMHDHEMYNRLVFVLNACHSGSILQHLPTDINVYAMNAANATQSGYGTMCPPHDKVEGKKIGTCLSSQFPAAFTVNSDIVNTQKETFELQFQLIQNSVTLSHAQQWGDIEWAKKNKISTMIGKMNQQAKPVQNPNLFWPNGVTPIIHDADRKFLDESVENDSEDGNVEQRLIELQYLMQQYEENQNQENFEELENYVAKSRVFKSAVQEFSAKYGLTGAVPETTNFGCYKGMLEEFEEQCGKLNDFSLYLAKYFYEYCADRDYVPHFHACNRQ